MVDHECDDGGTMQDRGGLRCVLDMLLHVLLNHAAVEAAAATIVEAVVITLNCICKIQTHNLILKTLEP